MAIPWKRLEDGAIAIAHISDLHFGSEGAGKVWQLLDTFLVHELRPELILVTGDLVHTPDDKHYEAAQDALEKLRLPYFVCAGNHDRFALGNRVERKFLSDLARNEQGKQLIDEARRQLHRCVLGIAVLAGLFAAILFGVVVAWTAGSPIGILTGVIAGLVTGIVVNGSAPGRIEGRLLTSLNARIDRFNVGDKGNQFESTFKDHQLSGQQTRPVVIGKDGAKWAIGLLALESSREADCFARGKIGSGDLSPLPIATQGKQVGGEYAEFDLCVLLVHHHLLPIRALEKEREGNATDLLNATCLVNSGSLLEKLAESRIDLALHGHEHKHNWGTYESLEEGFAPVRIVAAGSATGNNSFTGCSENDASFNVIILGPDRSVRLRHMVFEGGWKQDRDTDLMLFTAEQVRESRARRRALIDTGDVRAAYTSEIVKYIEFTRDRDIQLYWLWTNWKLTDERFRHRVTNSTGLPVRPVAVLSGAMGTRQIVADFVPIEGEDHAWNLCFTVPKEFLNQPIRVSVQYTWQGGGLLTTEELAALNHDGHLGNFRNQGLEFWSSRTDDRTIAALEVHLSLPSEFDPTLEGHPDAVMVRVHDAGNRLEHKAEAAALQKRLRFLAKGEYSLRIPFPRCNRNYTLAWQPVSFKTVNERLGISGSVPPTPDEAKGLLQAFAEPLRICATLGLYVKSADFKRAERRACLSLPESAQFPDPPQTIHLDHEEKLLVHAWWGTSESLIRPEDEEKAKHFGFEPGEIALVCVPLRSSLIGPQNLLPPWGVVRIGVRKSEQTLPGQMDDSTMWKMLSLASARLSVHLFR